MSAAAIVQIIAIAMALVLVLRGLRARNLPTATLVRWAVIWVVVIAGLALIVRYFGLENAIHLN